LFLHKQTTKKEKKKKTKLEGRGQFHSGFVPSYPFSHKLVAIRPWEEQILILARSWPDKEQSSRKL